MARFFIPRHWRMHKIIWALLILEFPFTVAVLALTGIASPNLYRTKLWQEGGDLGFNSDPTTILYAYANYRPVHIPLVWSSFITQFNLVVGVLSMFIHLTKFTMFILHVFWPIISMLVHFLLIGLWSYSIYAQTSPDTIDPNRQNHGAPWYITKNCNIASTHSLKGYCMQAKSTFAVSVVMLTMFVIHALVSIWSMIPSKEQKLAHAEKEAEKKAEKEKWSPVEEGMTAEQQWQHMWELQQLPRTPGTAGGMKSPMTPRTQAFNSLGGGLPLREHEYQPFPR
ncbi:uncharacterized protein BDZ99DRAFT_458890 [Mytilinidion resinicola]|uniref:Uncharacterized protein n=1 Tax=Mytilinidion resinicola TaxID=574789 RepID=A0A6A6Z3U3_9PEZI|nr:uncharacterized protein BDZ99DRAFT_458890 [Mytilinidion resinicola]KAF2814927.1 hypothetical protein BDZ99DRAFT_458890 [Mytilinidion resinicola]